ncbi:ATP-binding cassette domain-containing protein [Aminiphilus sp.]|uniref:ATP-binding cassette domain-containing protein n=1 Tax=Aminiphilus sp. TaxID=1872488 RepID=UPI002623451F|nr:ATP-binding cassette domain-containing protein [Aminiphilus sp.]
MTGDALYEVRNLKRAYGTQTVLDAEHLVIPERSVVGFVGPNGSGKSTLLRILAFLDTPSGGSLWFGGRTFWNGGDGDAEGRGSEMSLENARSEVTLLLQEPYLLKRSVFENVAYGLRVRGGLSGEEMRERVFGGLRTVGLDPERFASRAWYQLSGGEAQRVALASRLVLRPRALLLDEPTASVDVQSAARIKEAALRARDEWGTTLVVVSHDILWLNEVADEVVHFYGGKIVGVGPENLVSGPWGEEAGGMVLRRLTDGQILRAVRPPGGVSTEAVAAVDPGSLLLALSLPEGISARNALRCSVAQMLYENGTGRVLVKVAAGGLSLSARLTAEAVRELGLHPGQEVLALVKATAFRWL